MTKVNDSGGVLADPSEGREFVLGLPGLAACGPGHADAIVLRQLALLAAPAAAVPPRLGHVLGLLLDAARPGDCGGRAVLRPLWAEEAMHRAYSFVQLAMRPEMRIGLADCSMSRHWDHALAARLAALYRDLAITQDEVRKPCAEALRGVVHNLVALFGSGVGQVVVRTEIERLSLPAYQRRALVLAASELVVNALRHAFLGRYDGRIEVTLKAHDARRTRLAVADEGIGYGRDRMAAQRGIAGGLAGLLEAELLYRPRLGGGTMAEIVFPA